MGFIKPATPGTLVVAAATVLLILVSVSTPLLKSIWFLRAKLDLEVSGRDVTGDATLGAWGYCVGDRCTDPKLGYSLDIAQLLGINGRIAGISTSVLKWITYLMILHPIAAAFGIISTIFGLLAHMHNFAGTALTTCFASFAATFALLAFVFDIAVFVIAKQRIESTDGATAELGNAIWMTLAAMIMFSLSGCFFGFGACVIRKRRAGREASEKYRPQVDEEYGAKMRAEAISATQRDQQYGRKEGTLPNFSEHDRNNEQIPLSSMPDGGDDDGVHGGSGAYQPVRFASQTDVGAPSIVSGVGEGYGRRNPAAPGMPVSFSAADTTAAGYSPPLVGGVASRLGAEARANRGRATSADEERLNGPARQGSQTTEPFTGMYGHGSQDGSHQGYHDPYAPSTSPPPSQQQGGGAMAMPVPNVATSPTSQHFTSPTHAGAYPPYPTNTAPTPSHSTYPQPEKLAYPGASTSPPPQQQQQQYYVQNQTPQQTGNSSFLPPSSQGGYSQNADQHSIAPTYYTYDQQQQQHGGYQGGGGVPPIPEMPYPGSTQGGSSDMYGTPYGYGGAQRY